MIDLERVKEKAENIINFYLDSNWEFLFIGMNTCKHYRLGFDIWALILFLAIGFAVGHLIFAFVNSM